MVQLINVEIYLVVLSTGTLIVQLKISRLKKTQQFHCDEERIQVWCKRTILQSLFKFWTRYVICQSEKIVRFNFEDKPLYIDHYRCSQLFNVLILWIFWVRRILANIRWTYLSYLLLVVAFFAKCLSFQSLNKVMYFNRSTKRN